MIALLLLLAGADQVTLELEERAKVAVLPVFARGADAPFLREETLFAALRSALEDQTDLTAADARELAAEQDVVERCEEKTRFACWARAAHGAPYLWVINVIEEENGDALSTILIDTRLAAELSAKAPRGSAGWEDRLEDEIFRASTSSALLLERDEASDPGLLGAALLRLLRAPLAARFVRFGAIEVTAPLSGVAIEVDGILAGETVSETTLVRQVRPGSRMVTLFDRRGRIEKTQHAVIVEAGATAKISSGGWVHAAPIVWVKPATFWGGIGVAAAGAALVVFTAARSPSPEIFDACVGAGCGERPGFASLCEVSSGSSECLRGGKGVLAAPLGYSLFLTGTTWAVGAELEDREPYWTLIAGVAAGALAYTISALADDTGSLPESF